jgi:hypothetical protein
MNPEFVLYSKSECPLCDEFLTDLKKLLGPVDYTCHVINIDTDPDLKHRYGARIPVLVAEGRELCEQVFNRATVEAYLGKL